MEDVVTFFETQFIFYVLAVQVQSYRSSNRIPRDSTRSL